MLNLNDLQVFVQVVDHGGFAAAARALGVPKSTLSKRFSELEKAIGIRLVQRTSRSFAVTEVGKELHHHAVAMLIEAEAAEHVIRGRMAEPSGTVRITASMPVAQFRLAPLLPCIAASHPKITIVVDVTDRFVDVVQEGYDIAIRTHFAPLASTELLQRRLYHDPTWLVASPDYVKERGMPSSPGDANGIDGLLAPSDMIWMLDDGTGVLAEVTPSRRYVANETVCLLEAAKAGLGAACLAGSFCASAIASGELIRLLPGWTGRGVTSTLLMPHRRGQLPSVRVVADCLTEKLRNVS